MAMYFIWFTEYLNLPLVSTPFRSAASKRRIILLLTCLICVSYRLYKASAKKKLIKTSRTINISISKTVPHSIHLTLASHIHLYY